LLPDGSSIQGGLGDGLSATAKVAMSIALGSAVQPLAMGSYADREGISVAE
jgi:hypothetical protein